MKTTNHGYLSRLDHLRFFAIALVLLTHFSGSLPTPKSIHSVMDFIDLWIKKGVTGVSLFLVISGFIFCVITDAGEKVIDYKKFITNRLFRIFPLLLVIFFIVITINRENSTPMDVLRVLTLQLNTGHSYTGWGREFFPSGPIWTIAVEFQFYLIFPFLIKIMHQQGISKIFTMMICMFIIRAFIVFDSDNGTYNNLYHSITGRLDQFLWGMLFGYFYIKNKHTKFNNVQSFLLILTGVAIVTILMMAGDRSYFVRIFSFNLEALGWGFILLGYMKSNIHINKQVDSFFAYLGGLSYSLYLTHLPVGFILINKLDKYSFMHNGIATTLLIIFPSCIFISWITYSGIEKPFLMMRKKYL
ncbi:acyltransferase family protein [Citrobacter koseri]|nr:acyltransferase [Citrobacter koseri]